MCLNCHPDYQAKRSAACSGPEPKQGNMDQSKPPKTRLTFSWSAVPIELKRALVADKDDNGRRFVADDDTLSEWLFERYGERPPVKVFVRPSMGHVLLESWLPMLSKDDLVALYTKAAFQLKREAPSLRKADLLEYLQTCQLALGYRTILRTEFLSAYRANFPTAAGTKTPKLDALEDMVGHSQPHHEPLPHQEAAQASLSEQIHFDTDESSTGLLVLPTGAGKTWTAVRWLTKEALPRGIQVLWLAHQRELLTQARDTFRSVIAAEEPDVSYRTRMMVTGAGAVTLLGKSDTDIAFLSLPMLATRLDTAKKKRLAAFLSRPTVVVVDEAHHGGAETFHLALTECIKNQPVAMIGLTATPWPGALLSRARFRQLFATTFFEAHVEELTDQEILARPVIHTVESQEIFELTEEQRKQQANAPDLSTQLLQNLNSTHRNRVVVQAYLDNADQYGKCLVFVGTIAHADRLERLFRLADVPTRVVHGQADVSRPEVLKWFEDQTGQAVLVSVRMLTEGVDLPSAQSVLLARPTTSRILLRQMIGRALRGPRVGGDPEAHIINIRDQWTNLGDILEPPEVIELPDVKINSRRVARWRDLWDLPPIADADGQDLPAAVEAEAERNILEADRILENLGTATDQDGQELEGAPQDPLSPAERVRFQHPTVRRVVSPLAGWYDLADRRVAVYQHQIPGFEALIANSAESLQGTAMLSWFSDIAPPLPSQASLRDVRDHVRNFGEPKFHSFNDQSLPYVVASELAKGAWTSEERMEHVRNRWGTGAIQLQMGLQEFEEAVDAEIRRLGRHARREATGLNPEAVRLITKTDTPKPKLPKAHRDLDQIQGEVFAWMKEHTPTLVRDLRKLRKVHWSNTPTATTFGTWVLDTRGKSRGRARLVINSMLNTRRSIISDEALGYLVYHEMLHHVLPFRGHDLGFRTYESHWPNAAEHDATYDSLEEEFDLDPKRYR